MNLPVYPEGYLKYAELFNAHQFFEAHEVLETEWHKQKRGNDFYKGLIQLAAAFVHLQKNHPSGARELFQRSLRYLSLYLPAHEGLDLEELFKTIRALDEKVSNESVSWETLEFPKIKITKERS